MIIIALLLLKIYAYSGLQCSCSELALQQECMYAGCEWITNQSTNLQQCADRKPSNQPNCSDYDDQLICDFLEGCAWNNQGKCASFTECSDYSIDQYDTSDQCYLKDHSCRKGSINNQGFITCQTIDQFCNDYSNDFMTIKLENQNSMIASDISNQTSYINFRKKTIDNCISYQTLLNECSMIKNEVICTFVKNKYSKLICEWNNGQCIDAINIPQLNAEKCYLNTGGTYSWNNERCQICQGSKSNHTSNGRILAESLNQPTKTQIIKTYKTIISPGLPVIPTPTYVTRCNTTIDSLTTLICFTEGCLKVSGEKTQEVCKKFTGTKLDTLLDETQFDSVCQSDENSTISLSLPRYTLSNSSKNCFETRLYLSYTNGVKSGAYSRNINSSQICSQNFVQNDINDSNSYMKCQINSTVLISHTSEYDDFCNSLTEAQTEPNNTDSSQPITQNTFYQQCTRIHYKGALPKVDWADYIFRSSTPSEGKSQSKQNLVGVDNKMVENIGYSNYTAVQQINNKTDSFSNITKFILTQSYNQVALDNDPLTISKSNSTANTTILEEITTHIFNPTVKLP